MALYTKYRPQDFQQLVGQDHIRTTLLNEIKRGQLCHAFLFTGPRGTGKTTTARLIAKTINCTKRSAEGEPCNACEFCIDIMDGRLIDVIEIDAASNRGIDEIRELKEKIIFAPTRAQSKTYIIDEVHMLTKEAFNALLKTLEEPPDQVYFILCTTEIHKIPETIISRCQRFDFKRISVRTVMTRLNFIAQKEGIGAEDTALELIARHVEGGMRDAIGLLDQLTVDGKLATDHVRMHLGITSHRTIEELMGILEQRDVSRALRAIDAVYNEGYDLQTFVREILACLREKLLQEVNAGSDGGHWLMMIAHFEDARDMLRGSAIPQLPLEIAVIKICREAPSSLTSAAHTHAKETPSQIVARMPDAQASMPDKQAAAAAQAAEENTASELKNNYQFEKVAASVAEHWKRVLEHVEPPALRRSLTDARVSENEGALTLHFRSQFHKEKVDNIQHKARIADAIHHIFGKSVAFTCVVDRDTLMANPPQQEAPTPQPAEEKSQKKNLIEQAMELFGE